MMVGSLWSLAKPRELICLPEHQSFPLPYKQQLPLAPSLAWETLQHQGGQNERTTKSAAFFQMVAKKKKNKKRVNGPGAVQRSGAELKPLA